MAEYIYKTYLYHETVDVIGAPASNATDLADFTTNHAADVVDISDLDLAGTSFGIEKSYEDFDALVAGDYDWTDVRCRTDENAHELYLVTTTPIS